MTGEIERKQRNFWWGNRQRIFPIILKVLIKLWSELTSTFIALIKSAGPEIRERHSLFVHLLDEWRVILECSLSYLTKCLAAGDISSLAPSVVRRTIKKSISNIFLKSWLT